MADVHDPEVRSYNMSKIRSKDTNPELLVRSFLHRNGYRFRLHDKKIPGRPDIVLKRYKTVIFVHGCFWHAHENCKYFHFPETRQDYWIPKLKNNRANDLKNLELCKTYGWNPITIW